MKKKRDRLEIIRDILYIINENKSIGPTRILHKSNLSPQMFKYYIELLEKKNFISWSNQKNKKKFSVTKNGFEFLEKYRSIENTIRGFGL